MTFNTFINSPHASFPEKVQPHVNKLGIVEVVASKNVATISSVLYIHL